MTSSKSLPSISIGSNWATVSLPDGRELFFSYRTLIAFRGSSGQVVAQENAWGPTTGRHLNAADGGSDEAKARRMQPAVFQAAYAEEFGKPDTGAPEANCIDDTCDDCGERHSGACDGSAVQS